MAELKDLPKKDLELIAEGKFDEISEEAKLVVSQIGQPESAPEPEKPGIIASGLGGVLGREEHAGLSLANIAEELGQSAGPILGGAAGGAAGLPLGPAGVVAGVAAGSGAGRLAQTGLQDIASLAGSGVPIKPVGEALGEAKTEAIVGAAGAALTPAVAKAGVTTGKEVVKRMSQVVSGISPEAFARMVSRPREVLARMKDVVAEGLEAGQVSQTVKEWGEVFKETIKTNMKEASDAYDNIIQKQLLENPKYKDKSFNLLRGLGDEVDAVKKKFGYGQKGRIGTSTDDAKIFGKIDSALKTGKRMSAEGLYNLQKDINQIIGDLAPDKRTLRKALGEVLKGDKKAKTEGLKGYLRKNVPETIKANNIYSKASELRDILEEKFGMEDFPGKVANALRRNTIFADDINKVADELPAARAALEALRDSMAAAQFAPASAWLPRTGFTPGLAGGMITAGAATNPMALAAAMGTAPFLSPRAVGLGTGFMADLMQRMAPAMASKTGQVAARAVPGVTAAETERRLRGR